MNLVKEHHHTFLVAMFLVGALLVFGSFEARVPDSAIAATTPGQQSSSEGFGFENDRSCGGVCATHVNALANVVYTGEARKLDGSLLASGDVLRPGDKLNVTLSLLGSYNVLGSYGDSPPAVWANTVDPSKVSSSYGSSANTDASTLCGGPDGATYKIRSGRYFNCYVVGIQRPQVSISASGLSCDPFAVKSEVLGSGLRELTTKCTVTTSGPAATLGINIGQAPFAAFGENWAYFRLAAGQAIPSSYSGPPCNAISREGFETGNTVYNFCDPNEQQCNAFCERDPEDYSPVNCTNQCGASISLSASPNPVPNGGSATLRWDAQRVSSCTASGAWSGSRPTSGLESTGPFYNQSKLYTLTCSGDGGSAQESVAVATDTFPPFSAQTFSWNIDVAPNPLSAPTLTFTGSPTTINQGESAKLEWDSKNTTSCVAESGWAGNKPESGFEKVSPTQTTPYDLTCKGTSGENVSATVKIAVIQSEPANRPPVANAEISACPVGAEICTQSFQDSVTVTRGQPTNIKLWAENSSDPDGWTSTNGVSSGGKCEWNRDLNQGSPTFEPPPINNPNSPSACSISLGTRTFNDPPNLYTYQVLKITDNKGAVSNVDTVRVTVVAGPSQGFTCNVQGQCVFGGGGASCLTNAGCPGGGGGGGCIGNCGGGGGGGGGNGCANQAQCPRVPSAPNASQLGSDTSFFCQSKQVQISWQYQDPNGDPQASFRLQLDDDANFGSMLVDVYQDSSNKLFIVPPNVLAFAAKYYFRVAVKDSTGAWSNWSSSANFTTPTSCVPPSDFSLNSSNNISVNVTGVGTGTSNATTFRVSPTGGFSAAVTLTPQSISPNIPGIAYGFASASLDSARYSSGISFKVTVPGSTAPGNYTIKIKGKSGGTEKVVDVVLRVNSTPPEFREI